MSCQGTTRQYAVLYRLLTLTIEAPKKRNMTIRVTNILKEKVEKDGSKIEIKLQFPYVIQARYEYRTAADTHLQYHCA